MADPIVISVNGKPHIVQADPETPLLYVLRNELGLHGPQFGCGLEQCGSCMVIFGREAKQSCKMKVSEVGNTPIITL
ncbi:MAG TPA: 2Fe-2S iron-sulfur cluster-binding protein, partial [Anaerolineales bacterium]|nr:2Fe-2S iron-sulfur cluster-binding protein [Anaerolineales bacterium]